jgi:hypothetical protein
MVRLMWKQHLGICTALALLAIPLYVADMYLLKSRGGGWIALNMNGLIIIPYIAFAALHISVSSAALYQFPAARLLPLHLVSGVVSIGLLITGFVAYTSYQRARETAAYEKRTEVVQQLRKVIELRGWWYAPSAEAPTAIHVHVKVHESGRFSGNVDGRSETLGEMIFNTEDTPHRQTNKDEEFTQVFPLHFLKEGKADSVSITLYLFKGETGSAPENITIIFEDNPSSDYDGHFLYSQLPPPTPR